MLILHFWSSLVAAIIINVGFVDSQSPLQLEHKNGLFSESDPIKVNTRDTFLATESRFKLPGTLVPSKYILEIIPFIDEDVPIGAERWTAPSNTKIYVNCTQSTSSITLHSNLLTIQEHLVTVVRISDSEPLSILNHAYDKENHFYIIHLEDALDVGEEYEISIGYIAPISGDDLLNGLYRSSYTNPSGEVRWLASTQFQATFARQMFPCFDEPDLKAVFEINVGRKQGYTTLCNTAVVSSIMREIPGWFWDKCAPTVKMSTYLVAIVVSDYNCTAADEGLYDKKVQACAPPHVIERGGGIYAADTSAKQLKFFDGVFGIDYALGKMDSVVVPNYASGAMENWGLNIYRESYLLYFDGETTEYERSRVSYVLAHELTHQWMGNLITCKWWNNLWINEGFATYFSYIGSFETDPEFETTQGILTDAFQYSMQFDARWDYSHPVLQDAFSPDEVKGLFDRMAYEKAGSLIRMMEGFLTTNTFRVGLTRFLNKMEYQGVDHTDLFLSLTEQAHEDGTLSKDISVEEIMNSWIMQKGFPLVRVSRGGNNNILISQETFSNNLMDLGGPPSPRQPETETEDLWYIPVSIVTQDQPNLSSRIPLFWINKDVSMRSYAQNTDKWIMVNPDGYGYYRVWYDSPLANLIQKQLNEDHTVISSMSRSQLLDDYFNLAFQKYTSIETAFEFTKYMTKETDYVVWVTLITNLRKTYNMLSGTTAINGFRKYFLPRLEGGLSKHGFEQQSSEKGVVVMHRAQLLDWTCAMEHPSCVQYATTLFNQWKENPTNNPVPLDLQPIIYCTAVAHGNNEDFNFAFDRYKTATLARQKSLLLNAMGCAREVGSLSVLLDIAVDATSGLARSDSTTAIQRVAMNPVGRPLVLRFLNSNMDTIISEFIDAEPIASIVSTLSTYTNTKEELNTLQFFINSQSFRPEVQEIQESLNKSIANIEANISWMSQYFESMKAWLESQS